MVAGYVVMRIALVGQWLRAAVQDPPRRSACLTYASAVVIAQIGWVVQIFVQTSLTVFFVSALVLMVVGGRRADPGGAADGGTPWHAHHVAERYGLLAIIALGEGVVGTVASLTAAVGEHGWSTDAILLVAAGIGLTFGMWWVYFLIPAGELLHARRRLSFWYGYLHLAVFGAIVATGAGLHVAAYYIDGESKLDSVGTVLAVAIPVAHLPVLDCSSSTRVWWARSICSTRCCWCWPGRCWWPPWRWRRAGHRWRCVCWWSPRLRWLSSSGSRRSGTGTPRRSSPHDWPAVFTARGESSKLSNSIRSCSAAIRRRALRRVTRMPMWPGSTPRTAPTRPRRNDANE